MRQFFESGKTRSYAFRREQLIKLKNAVRKFEEPLHEALYADLKKSPEECWVTETGFLQAELSNAIKNLKRWMQPELVPTNLLNIPSSSRVMKEPLGVVLIIGPWNYPLMLLLTPLVGAIAAGNCAVIKGSEFAPATASVIRQMMEENFDKEYIFFQDGDGATEIPAMMNHFSFDHVFYTGSTAVGKIIYRMAAERLVPVTLELGGKSPCVVESDAHIKVAARRIVQTKFSNAGQMCVAPDYVLVHAGIKEKLVAALKEAIGRFYGEQPEESYNYGKIINEKQFSRLIAYLDQGTIVHGGRTDKQQLFIEPTILDNVPLDAPVMQDEIFGPVLPLIPFQTSEEALAVIAKHKNPLAFYVFTSNSRTEKKWLEGVAFGGGCVNNASWHLTNHHLPFGGRGFSGTGHYHGRYSFETFSHKKAVMKTPAWFDPAIKYPPFKGKLKLFKWVIR
ncbi:MAG TPA: aldehyde dehydrogenase [Ferruginibacter sp.]|nr:aldehyde dehydrogenase [Ferruginibacter sp.]HNA00282.1 aldehyde dehydrogenase [Ferruginibacter sp.]HNK27337.1 aldehyde dehydrogenase [Ferruginibacter sp.]